MTRPLTFAKTAQALSPFLFPDSPEREPDDTTSFDRLAPDGNAYL